MRASYLTSRLLLICFFAFSLSSLQSQNCKIANFGIDQDLMEDTMYVGTAGPGLDDWFYYDTTQNEFAALLTNNYSTPAYPANSGIGVIDTTGARSLARQAYRYSLTRRMSLPPYTLQSDKILLDALFHRDSYDNSSSSNDSSIYIASGGASQPKNGDNPNDWKGGSGSMQGKNDIIEVLAHARRNGNSINKDLWLFHGASLRTTTGSRYLDFELYQSELSYDAKTGRFSNAGPDEGHTAWEFGTDGQVVQVGDLITAFEFDNNGIQQFDIRVWVSRYDFDKVTPATFAFDSIFDGSSSNSQFGYATIIPLNGLSTCNTINKKGSTRAGPFGTINSSANFSDAYDQFQFVELGINLTDLGVDPAQIQGLNPCSPLFKRIMVKSRASGSFTSALKDFIPPQSFLDYTFTPVVAAPEDLTCGDTLATLQIVSPFGHFEWTSINGNIVGNNTGPTIQVNQVGSYIVESRVFDGCPLSQTDTVQVIENLSQPTAVAFGGTLSYSKLTDTLLAQAFPNGGNFVWSHPNGFSSTLANPIVADTGSYTVIATDAITGCKDTTTAYVGWTLTILPVELLTFKLMPHAQQQTVGIYWEIAENTSLATRWLVERGTSPGTLTPIWQSQLQSGQQQFQLIDPEPYQRGEGTYYYRLRWIDSDGFEQHSSIQAVQLQARNNPLLTMNSEANNEEGLQIQYRHLNQLQLFDLHGRLLSQLSLMEKEEVQTQRINTRRLPKGTYLLKGSGSRGQVVQKLGIR